MPVMQILPRRLRCKNSFLWEGFEKRPTSKNEGKRNVDCKPQSKNGMYRCFFPQFEMFVPL